MERLDMSEHLDNWSLSIRLDKKEAARSIYEELNKSTIDLDAETHITYLLLKSRYHTILGG
ncbi:hypothetical protein [Terribacillus sp. 7520-G]|uniref:hypothetical protein n=1 Tax=Terribacillus sp. 7520-G TaxID=2025389 RepID=UPI000BA606E0|nr:hypothetical protein [Terribacillus sp. 7520-G]PAD40153.1 hypothetical protein CHH53_03820 [Terribacillus sp. 7520-G]